jgi:thioredoxin-like negative regulator of GroEL
LLEIVQADRNWNESKAYNYLLDVFKKVGAAAEEVREGRKKLSKILF